VYANRGRHPGPFHSLRPGRRRHAAAPHGRDPGIVSFPEREIRCLMAGDDRDSGPASVRAPSG